MIKPTSRPEVNSIEKNAKKRVGICPTRIRFPQRNTNTKEAVNTAMTAQERIVCIIGQTLRSG
jgi:hypothetical protein